MIYTAGILFYEQRVFDLRVWLVHPSSVINDNSKAKWSIPKGEMDAIDENSFRHCAIREVKEEIGIEAQDKDLYYLGCSLYKHGQKTIHGFCHPYIGFGKLSWEINSFAPYSIEEAKTIIHHTQVVFLDRLQEYLIQRKVITI